MAHSKPWKTTVRLWDERAKDFVTREITVTIDWQAAAEYLARRAVHNKSGRAIIVGGKIAGQLLKPN